MRDATYFCEPKSIVCDFMDAFYGTKTESEQTNIDAFCGWISGFDGSMDRLDAWMRGTKKFRIN